MRTVGDWELENLESSKEDFENKWSPRHTRFLFPETTRTSGPDRWVSDSPAANNTVLRLKGKVPQLAKLD